MSSSRSFLPTNASPLPMDLLDGLEKGKPLPKNWRTRKRKNFSVGKGTQTDYRRWTWRALWDAVQGWPPPLLGPT